MSVASITLNLQPTTPLRGLSLRWPREELTLDPARAIPLEVRRGQPVEGEQRSDTLTLLVEGGVIAPPSGAGHDWKIWEGQIEGHRQVRLEGRCTGDLVVLKVLPDSDERLVRVQALWGDRSAAVALPLHPSFKQSIRETLESLIYAFFIAILLRTFLFQAFYIPSQSMEPTLQISDRLVANKFLYKFREPERHEVIIFRVYQRKPAHGRFSFGDDPQLSPPPAAIEGQFEVKDYIKRVIGLPGDTVAISDGRVLINGEVMPEPYLPNNIALKMRQDFGPETVAPGHYFVMGDNRNNSKDSRFIGQVPREAVVGKAHVVFWPLQHARWLE